MKTALRQLHEKFKKVNGELVDSDFEELFENEKDQIIEAYFEGGGGIKGEHSSYTKAEQYFNQTFL